MEVEIVFVIIWLLVGGIIGAAIGSGKNRGLEGLLMGAFLGPVGWILAAIIDYPRKCPACHGGVPASATVCKNCGRELADRSVPQRYVNEVEFACPACGFPGNAEPEQLMRGVRCEKCGVGFVPNTLKRK